MLHVNLYGVMCAAFVLLLSAPPSYARSDEWKEALTEKLKAPSARSAATIQRGPL